MNEKSTLDMIQEIVRVKINITLAGAIELSAFPLDAIREVLTHFKPHPTRSSYSMFKRQLNTYCSSNGIQPTWKEMFQLRDAMGIGEYAAKEEPLKGSSYTSAGNIQPSARQSSGFVTVEERPDGSKIIQTPDGQRIRLRGNKYKTMNYRELHDEFAQRQLEGREPIDMNPFSVRKDGQGDLERTDYQSQQEDERLVMVDERNERGRIDREEKIANMRRLKELALRTHKSMMADKIDQAKKEVSAAPEFESIEDAERWIEEMAAKVSLQVLEEIVPEPVRPLSEDADVKLQKLAIAAQFLEEHKKSKSVSDNANSAYFKAIAMTATPLVEEPVPVYAEASVGQVPYDGDDQWEEVFDI